jgi:Na+/H+-dicarboxylate symporter
MAGLNRDALLTALILVSMVLGVGLGLGARQWAVLAAVVDSIGWLGVLFKQLLLLIIYPLVLASIYVGVVGLGDIRKTGGVAARAVTYFLCTTAVSVVLGLVLVNILEPGEGFDLGTVEPGTLSVEETTLGAFFIDLLRNTFKNPFASLAQGDVLAIIAFSLLLGLVSSVMGQAARPLTAFFESLNEAMMILTGWIMWLAPLGVLALLSKVVAAQGLEVLVALWSYMRAVLAGLFLHGLLVLPLVAWMVAGVSPVRLLRGMRAPLAVAFSTASSAATLPVTIDTVEREFEVTPRVTRFVLPLGATLNMDGTALYEAMAAMFIAQAYGIELGLGSQVLVFLTATIAAVGAAGIPGAGLVTLGIVLQAVGLPLEAIALILAVDRLLDMCRTAVNVEGDSVGCLVVQRWDQGAKE